MLGFAGSIHQHARQKTLLTERRSVQEAQGLLRPRPSRLWPILLGYTTCQQAIKQLSLHANNPPWRRHGVKDVIVSVRALMSRRNLCNKTAWHTDDKQASHLVLK